MATNSTEIAVLGGGCFWCLEASFQLIKGVEEVIPGYSGGTHDNPTYEQTSYANTGEAEVVRITFNTGIISYRDILDIFWALHDPTTPDRQGNDVGKQYRSVIFYKGDQQKKIAEESKKRTQKLWKSPIVTAVVPLEKFYEAEEYHHNYFNTHPEQAYCQIVINPKLKKLREKFATKLKS